MADLSITFNIMFIDGVQEVRFPILVGTINFVLGELWIFLLVTHLFQILNLF